MPDRPEIPVEGGHLAEEEVLERLVDPRQDCPQMRKEMGPRFSERAPALHRGITQPRVHRFDHPCMRGQLSARHQPDRLRVTEVADGRFDDLVVVEHPVDGAERGVGEVAHDGGAVRDD